MLQTAKYYVGFGIFSTLLTTFRNTVDDFRPSRLFLQCSLWRRRKVRIPCQPGLLCFTHSKGWSTAKKIWPKTSEKTENRASASLAWCQHCEQAGICPLQRDGGRLAGQLCFASCFPPEEAVVCLLEKEHLSCWLSDWLCPISLSSQGSSPGSQVPALFSYISGLTSSLVCRDRGQGKLWSQEKPVGGSSRRRWWVFLFVCFKVEIRRKNWGSASNSLVSSPWAQLSLAMKGVIRWPSLELVFFYYMKL